MTSIRPLTWLPVLMGLFLVPSGQGVTTLWAQVERQTGPPPQVASWSPREKAHPGQRLVITGRDFASASIRVSLTGPSGSVQLPIRSATASRIEAEITDAMYTGAQGARLSVSDAGGGMRVLEEGFRVLKRDAVFRGTSFWRESTSAHSGILARGNVELRLDRFEFQEGGTGTYSETVRLVRLVREWEVECPAGDLVEATRDGGQRMTGDRRKAGGREWSWRNARAEREIEWRRLPDGRVELRKVGLQNSGGGTHDALARLEGQALGLSYETRTAGPYSRPVTQEPDCNGAAARAPEGVPPVRSAPFRLVEWSLERLDLQAPARPPAAPR